MMETREKILEAIEEHYLQEDSAEDEKMFSKILAAVADGCEPVYQWRASNSHPWMDNGKAAYDNTKEPHNRRILYTSPMAAAFDDGVAKRLRRVCKLVGIESQVPADDLSLHDVAFSVLGQVARAIEAAPPVVASEPVLPKFNCFTDDEGDSWRDHPADADIIYSAFGNTPEVGNEYELRAGWKCVDAKYRITSITEDGDVAVECISHPNENTAPQPQQPDNRDEAESGRKMDAQTIAELSEKCIARDALIVELQLDVKQLDGTVHLLVTQRDNLQARLAAAEKDAERYRDDSDRLTHVLLNGMPSKAGGRYWYMDGTLFTAAIDCIDAAIAAGKEQQP